jgi:prolyl 4-hydroxylase
VVALFDDFGTDLEIEDLIAAARPQLQTALVSAAESGVESEGRSGQNCWIPHDQSPRIQALAQRMADLVGLGLEHAENFQVLHYAPTQRYNPHYDAWDLRTERGQRCMATKGQRLVTCLLYLNDPGQGGGTNFPNLLDHEIVVQAKKGRMIVFHNCQEGTILRHVGALHGGMPVEKGEKWACNLWFRERPFRTMKK